jgi:hypothetical protein
MLLTAPHQGLPPGAGDFRSEAVQAFEVARHRVVVEIAPQRKTGTDTEVSPKLSKLRQKLSGRSKGGLEHARGGTIFGGRPNLLETAPCMR